MLQQGPRARQGAAAVAIGGIVLLAISVGENAMADARKLLQLSHDATARVQSIQGNSSGSGFFIDDQYLITCFHVIVALAVESNPGTPTTVRWTVHPDIKVKLPSGNEEVSATVISLPTEADPTPLTQDFAILKLAKKPAGKFSKLELSTGSTPSLGDEIVFSGFPLATPGMVTHRGEVSGTDETSSLIFVQASINKGNSGGALIDEQGKVVGIVSMREGGISQGLAQLSDHITKTAKQGTVLIMGADPLQAIREIIGTLDQYISTGIGYARSIKFVREYITKHPLK